MDNEIKNTNNQSLKIQLSLASLMFFSPFIKHLLKKNDFELDNNELDFVNSYISLWWIHIVLLLLALASGLGSYFYSMPTVETAYQIIVGILIFLLTIWCIWAITEIKIIHTSYSENSFENYDTTDKLHKILAYLPGYSIYLWYNKHDFEKPDVLIKESLFLWIVFGFSCFFSTSIITVFIWIAMLIRIITLLWNINILPTSISEFFNKLFYKNPEEIWAYVWWSIEFIFHGNYNLPYWKLLVENTKKEYQYLYDIKKFGVIQRQYWLWLLSTILLLRQVDLWNMPWLSIFAVLLLLVRYGVMIFIWWRSPALPIMREIILLATTIIKPFTSKK